MIYFRGEGILMLLFPLQYHSFANGSPLRRQREKEGKKKKEERKKREEREGG